MENKYLRSHPDYWCCLGGGFVEVVVFKNNSWDPCCVFANNLYILIFMCYLFNYNCYGSLWNCHAMNLIPLVNSVLWSAMKMQTELCRMRAIYWMNRPRDGQGFRCCRVWTPNCQSKWNGNEHVFITEPVCYLLSSYNFHQTLTVLQFVVVLFYLGIFEIIFTLFRGNKAENLRNMFTVKARFLIMESASYMTHYLLKKVFMSSFLTLVWF